MPWGLEREIERETVAGRDRKRERGRDRVVYKQSRLACKSILIETATKQLKLSSFTEPNRNSFPPFAPFRLWFSVSYKLNFDTKLN